MESVTKPPVEAQQHPKKHVPEERYFVPRHAHKEEHGYPVFPMISTLCGKVSAHRIDYDDGALPPSELLD